MNLAPKDLKHQNNKLSKGPCEIRRCLTIKMRSNQLKLNAFTIHKILTSNSHMWKIHAKIVPCPSWSFDFISISVSPVLLFIWTESLCLLSFPQTENHLRHHFGTQNNIQHHVTNMLTPYKLTILVLLSSLGKCLRQCVCAKGKYFEGDNNAVLKQ